MQALKTGSFPAFEFVVWCAAGAQRSSALTSGNNVGRCALDQTEWHLPRYPWDWVSIVKTFCCLTSDYKKKRLKSWVNESCVTQRTVESWWMEMYTKYCLCVFPHWVSALASVCPQRMTPKHYWTFCCFCLPFHFCSKNLFPPFSVFFFSILHSSLPSPLSN